MGGGGKEGQVERGMYVGSLYVGGGRQGAKEQRGRSRWLTWRGRGANEAEEEEGVVGTGRG